MSDQQAADEQPVDSPEEGTDTPQVPAGYIPENDYKEVQAWSTREAQWRAAHEPTVNLLQAAEQGDEEAQRALIGRLGYQLPDEEDEFESVDEPLTRAEFQQFLQEQQTQTQQQEHAQQVRAVVDAQLKEWGLDDEDGNDVLAYAIHALPMTDEGLPDVWAAYERFQKRETVRQKAWRESKRAPHNSPVGREGNRAPKLNTTEDKTDWILEQLAANE